MYICCWPRRCRYQNYFFCSQSLILCNNFNVYTFNNFYFKGRLYHARNLDFGLLLGYFLFPWYFFGSSFNVKFFRLYIFYINLHFFFRWDDKNNTWLVSEKLRKLMVIVDYQVRRKVNYFMNKLLNLLRCHMVNLFWSFLLVIFSEEWKNDVPGSTFCWLYRNLDCNQTCKKCLLLSINFVDPFFHKFLHKLFCFLYIFSPNFLLDCRD